MQFLPRNYLFRFKKNGSYRNRHVCSASRSQKGGNITHYKDQTLLVNKIIKMMSFLRAFNKHTEKRRFFVDMTNIIHCFSVFLC